MTDTKQEIAVDVRPSYLEQESEPLEQRFVFAYRVRIANHTKEPVRLLLRHWRITDGEGSVREIDGMGVVGEQPLIAQNDEFSYTSGAVLKTSVGYMEGHYVMRTNSDKEIKVAIPRFRLEQPNALN